MTHNGSPSIAIAGGGLMGRLLAWRLSRRGLNISLFEAGSLAAPTGACWTAAGMISPLSELVHSERQIYELGLHSLALWESWASQLEAQVGCPVSFRRAGSIVVAHGRDRAELQMFERELQSKLASASAADIQSLDRAGLLGLEPALGTFEGGIFLRDEGDIDNRRLLPALLEALRLQRVTLHEDSPVVCEKHTITGREAAQRFDCVIDCRGLGAKDAIDGLRGVRGEVLVVETSEVQLHRPVRLLHPRYQLYAVPRSGARTVIGATEIDSDDLSPISVRSIMELSSALYSLHPAFAEARIVETRVNCRPATMDNLPRLLSEPGLVRVNGLYRHGYLLAPALLEQVEKIIADQLSEVA
ncbi:glycine oxidase ThiO [Microbulbifer sp. SAOS-129_SWC]|uniref:glycine oxidase ThiO n=1 Tax=Microbulbifer sp. SAOS-129_SWC TaxID=3145235 RepID=UPI003216A396